MLFFCPYGFCCILFSFHWLYPYYLLYIQIWFYLIFSYLMYLFCLLLLPLVYLIVLYYHMWNFGIILWTSFIIQHVLLLILQTLSFLINHNQKTFIFLLKISFCTSQNSRKQIVYNHVYLLEIKFQGLYWLKKFLHSFHN